MEMLVQDFSIYSIVALALAVVFGVIGVVQLIAPPFVKAAYKAWDFPERVRLVTGVLDIAAALLLAVPASRGWGIVLAGILTFGSIVVFLSHRQYRYALPAVALMAALIPTTMAVPRTGQVQFVSQRQIPTDGDSQTVVASRDTEPGSASIE